MTKKKPKPQEMHRADWKLADIHEYPNNPKNHPPAQVALLAELLKKYGPDQDIVVDENGVILKGHGRKLAALAAGMDTFPVTQRLGLSAADKTAMRISDNQVSLLGGWDQKLIQLEVASLQLAKYDMPLLGFSEFALTQIMAPVQGPPPEPEIPAAPKNPVTKKGDLWILGKHRILCGDCREPHDVDRLLQDAKINVAFTSPPYAEQRQYDEKSGFRPIPPADYVAWFKPAADNVAQHLAPDGSWFVNIKASVTSDGLDTDLYVLDLVIAHARTWGWHFATEFCWERNGVPKKVTRRFKNQFESVYQFSRGDWKMRPDAVRHVSDNVPLGVGPYTWSDVHGKPGGFTAANEKKKKGFPTGEQRQGTNWQHGAPLGVPMDQIGEGLAYPGNRLPTFNSTHEALGHAAAFPVGLPSFFILAYSDEGDAVYDPFLGSGSTLIAAEQTKRIGFGMELSPAYVDVAVERWQRLTGKTAKRETGKKRQPATGRRSSSRQPQAASAK